MADEDKKAAAAAAIKDQKEKRKRYKNRGEDDVKEPTMEGDTLVMPPMTIKGRKKKKPSDKEKK